MNAPLYMYPDPCSGPYSLRALDAVCLQQGHPAVRIQSHYNLISSAAPCFEDPHICSVPLSACDYL
jgi:hypothetical protein